MTNGSFCMMPWVHMHFWPNGAVYPCCLSDSTLSMGNTNQCSVPEIWNGEPLRELRRNMLSGEPNRACQRCYDLESAGVQTLRQQSILDYQHHQAIVDSTLPDGTVPKVNMAYLDVRFSNICNLRCRTCGPDLSSSWYDDTVAQWPSYDRPRIVNINHRGDFWPQLLPYLSDTEEVYFAGGESLLTEEHYRILDHWITTGHTGVRIRYTTNFTVLDYKKRDLFELWQHFPNITITASLDGSGARAEYLRKNCVWPDIVANRQRMQRELPHMRFHITPTVSLINLLHLPDFHAEWITQGLIGADDIRINLLTKPEHSSVRVLPPTMKAQAQQRVEAHCEWLSQQGAKPETLAQWLSVITYMHSGDDSHLLSQFLERQRSLDLLRSESLFTVFPELKPLDSSTWCVLPWTNINTTPQGQIKLCCNITHPRDVLLADGTALDWSTHSLDEIWNGDHLRAVRQQMLLGQAVSSCEVCYKQEALGNQSPRLSALRETTVQAQHCEPVARDLPTSFELRTSTRCNLSCSSCWAGSSDQIAVARRKSLEWAAHDTSDPWYLAMPEWLRTAWAAEQDLTQSDTGYANRQTSMANFEQLAPGLQRLYVTGGEPTMDNNLYKYMEALLAAGNTSCHVSFTTNCTLWNPKLMQRLGQFTNTEVQLSVDAHGAANDFIRQNSKWHEVTANVDRYLSTDSLTTIKFYTVISALNCLELSPLLEWIINTVNSHGRPAIWFPIVLESPAHLRVTALPLAVRLAAADLLEQQFTSEQWPPHCCDYQHGLRHCLAALRDPEQMPVDDGIHKLREWLFYDWHMRRRYAHDRPTQYWNFVLPQLAQALEWTEADWSKHV